MEAMVSWGFEGEMWSEEREGFEEELRVSSRRSSLPSLRCGTCIFRIMPDYLIDLRKDPSRSKKS